MHGHGNEYILIDLPRDTFDEWDGDAELMREEEERRIRAILDKAYPKMPVVIARNGYSGNIYFYKDKVDQLEQCANVALMLDHLYDDVADWESNIFDNLPVTQ